MSEPVIEAGCKAGRRKEEEVVNIREGEERMEYRPQETAYLESTIGVPDQQQSRSLVPDTRYTTSMTSDGVLL